MPSIGIVKSGLTYDPKDISDCGTPVLRSPNINNGKIVLNEIIKVKKTIRDNQYMEQNDILICARNGSKALVGKCAIFNINESTQYSFGAFMMSFKTPFYKYIYYYLNSNLFRSLLNKDDTKQINQVTLSTLRKTLVPLPPLSEQERITNLLTNSLNSISNICTDTDEIKEIVSVIKKKVLENVFSTNSSYKSYYPSLPLKDICKLDKRENKSSGKLPYLEAKVIRGQKSPTILESGSLVYKGEKIILVDGENSGEVMTVPYDGYMGSTFKLLTIDTNKLDIEYFGFYLLTHKQQFRENKTGSAVPHLNKKIFNSLEICVPPIEEQKKITANLKNIFEKLNIVAS